MREADLNALQAAWLLCGDVEEAVGEKADGWIIGATAWAEILRCRNAHVAVTEPTLDAPRKLYGLPVTIHGREGVYPTFDAALARSMRWFTTAGPEPWFRIIRVFGTWRGREFAYSHVVDTMRPRDLPRILAHMDLACRRLAFTDETVGPTE